MAISFEIVDNTGLFKEQMARAMRLALEEAGATWENYAKDLADGVTPEIVRNSIKSIVSGNAVQVGSNNRIAPYFELGTGREYRPAPDFIQTAMEWAAQYAPGGAENKGKAGAGIEKWLYWDELREMFRWGTPREARPFLAPAFENHQKEYREIIEERLRNANG